MSATALVSGIRATLVSHADPGRAPGQQAYMKSALPYYGIDARDLERLVKAEINACPLLDRPAWEAAVRRLVDEATHREEWYAALQVARHKRYSSYQDPDAVALYHHVITTTRWWDVVDVVAVHSIGTILREYPDSQKPRMRSWAVADDVWVRRTAILCQLHFAAATDTELLSEVISANLEGSTFGNVFWIRKAIGWALRQYARTNADWVVEWVSRNEDRLSGLSRREALKRLG